MVVARRWCGDVGKTFESLMSLFGKFSIRPEVKQIVQNFTSEIRDTVGVDFHFYRTESI